MMFEITFKPGSTRTVDEMWRFFRCHEQIITSGPHRPHKHDDGTYSIWINIDECDDPEKAWLEHNAEYQECEVTWRETLSILGKVIDVARRAYPTDDNLNPYAETSSDEEQDRE